MVSRKCRNTLDLAKDVVVRPVDGAVSLENYFFTAEHHLGQVSTSTPPLTLSRFHQSLPGDNSLRHNHIHTPR